MKNYTHLPLCRFVLVLGATVAFCAYAVPTVKDVRLPSIYTVPHELDCLLKAGHIQGACCSEKAIYLSHQLFVVKALGGNMHGWRKDPVNNPPRIRIDFHAYSSGAFKD